VYWHREKQRCISVDILETSFIVGTLVLIVGTVFSPASAQI